MEHRSAVSAAIGTRNSATGGAEKLRLDTGPLPYLIPPSLTS